MSYHIKKKEQAAKEKKQPELSKTKFENHDCPTKS